MDRDCFWCARRTSYKLRLDASFPETTRRQTGDRRHTNFNLKIQSLLASTCAPDIRHFFRAAAKFRIGLVFK